MTILSELRRGRLFKSKKQLDLVDGPLKENLFFLAVPIVGINMLRTAYSLIDTFWLGRYSETALAAISVAFPVQYLIISLGFGVAITGSVLVAQREGGGRSEEVVEAASQTMGFGLLAALVTGAIGYFAVEQIVRILGAEPATVPAATGYLQVVSLGMFTIFGFSLFIAQMRAYGEALTPMLLMLATVLLNAVLDPVFIFGWWVFPEMGATGAALVTVLLRFAGLVAAMAILLTGWKGLRIDPAQMVPTREFGRKILNIGLPASAESMGRAFSVNVTTAVVGLFGSAVMGGYGIGIRIFSLVFLPAVALDRSVETVTGQNLGAGKFDRAQMVPEMAVKAGFLLLTGLGVICFSFPGEIASVFTSDPEIAGIASTFIRYNALTFGFIAMNRGFSGAFRAAGRTVLPAVLAVGTIGLLRAPLAFILSRGMGPDGIWTAFPVSNVVGGIAALVMFLLVDWKRRVD